MKTRKIQELEKKVARLESIMQLCKQYKEQVVSSDVYNKNQLINYYNTSINSINSSILSHRRELLSIESEPKVKANFVALALIVLVIGTGVFAFASPSITGFVTSINSNYNNYNKIQEDDTFDVIIDSSRVEDGNLIIRFHHNSVTSKPVSVIGDVDYDLSTNFADRNEEIILTVYNYNNQYFKLKVGENTEIVEFGNKSPELRIGIIEEPKETETIEFGANKTEELEFGTGEINQTEELEFGTGEINQTEIVEIGTNQTNQTEELEFGLLDDELEVLRQRVKSRRNSDKVDLKNLIKVRDTFELNVEFSREGLGVLGASINGKVDIKGIQNISDIEYIQTGSLENNLFSIGEINTEVLAVNPISVNNAEITLPKNGEVDTIVKCNDWNSEEFRCNGDWIEINIPFVDNIDTVTFSVNEFSAYGGAIIEITNAEHLDSNREFISYIYNEVKELDDIWSEPINNNEYVRVTFERNLTSENDITIYPRITDGDPTIEVYEYEGTELIAEFTDIIPNKYNRVILTELEGSQDVFDLRIINGVIKFDHIIDPPIYSWAGCGNNNFRVYEDDWTSLHTGTLVCSANVTDVNGDTCNCGGDILISGTEYYIEICLDETIGTVGIFKENDDDWWNITNFKGSSSTWGGTNPMAGGASNEGPTITANTWDVGNDDKFAEYGVDYWEALQTATDISFRPVDVSAAKLQIELDNDEGSGNEWMVMNITLDSDASSSSASYLTAQDTGDVAAPDSCKLGMVVNAPDTTAPSIDVTYPANKSNITDTWLNITGTAIDASEDTVWINDTTNFGTNQGTYSSWNFTNVTPLTDGIYWVNISANDTGGYQNSTIIWFNFTNADISPPIITPISPSNNSFKSMILSVTINGTASDDNEDSIFSNDTRFTWNNVYSPWVLFNNTPIDEGVIYINISANDTGGYINSTYWNFTLDNTLPYISVDFPTDGSTVKSFWINITGTASDDNEDTVWINGSEYGDVPLFDANTGTFSSWNFTNTSALTDRSYSYNITANDSAGNQNSTVISFTRDALGELIMNLTWPNSTYQTPTSYLDVTQNTTFDINVTITCSEDSCGYVQAWARYNTSTKTYGYISNYQGESPLYIMNTSVIPPTAIVGDSSFTKDCYQETANVSTICGGIPNFIDAYTCVGTFSEQFPCWMAFDGDWETYSEAASGNAYIYINYTKPLNVNKSNWMIRDLEHKQGGTYGNMSLDDYGCWDSLPDNKIAVRILLSQTTDKVHWQCWDGVTPWNDNIKSNSKYAYEEAIWWNISLMNEQRCGIVNPGQECKISWTVNATDPNLLGWQVDVNTTGYTSETNDSADAYINITEGVDNTPPKITVTFPTNNTAISSEWLNITGTTVEDKADTIWTNHSNFTVMTGTYSSWNFTNTSPLIDGVYFINISANDTSGNQNSTILNFTFTYLAKSITMTLSSNLTAGAIWNISSLPALEANSTGNNDSSFTFHNISIAATGTSVDVYIRANNNLTDPDESANYILLPNETFANSTNLRNVTDSAKTSLSTTWQKLAANLENGANLYLKFFLNVSASQSPASYNNSLEIKAVEYGDPP